MSVSREHVDTAIEALSVLHDETAKIVEPRGAFPSAGSRGANERAELNGIDHFDTVFTQAMLLVEGAADHLGALVKNLTEPVQTLAPWTCLRALMESCALSAWLLDPKITALDRLGRSFALYYEGLDQQMKWARAERKPAHLLGMIEQRIEEIDADARAAGLPPVVNKKRRRVGIGCRMPGATDVIDKMLSEGTTYRLLSAVAHGHSWAIQNLSFRLTGKSVDTPPSAAGRSADQFHHITKTLTLQNAAFICCWSAKWFAIPIWYQCLLLGWDKEEVAAVLERAADSTRIKESSRFWRLDGLGPGK